MPIYEYRCEACNAELEVQQSISADPLKECPECEASEGLKRLISQTSFVLKGSGWYATDYKNSGTPKSPAGTQDSGSSDSSTPSTSDSGSSSGTSSDSGSSSGTSSDSGSSSGTSSDSGSSSGTSSDSGSSSSTSSE